MPRIIDDEIEPQHRESVQEPRVPHVVHDRLPEQRKAEPEVRDDESVLTGLGNAPTLEDLNSILDPFAPAPPISHQEEKHNVENAR